MSVDSRKNSTEPGGEYRAAELLRRISLTSLESSDPTYTFPVVGPGSAHEEEMPAIGQEERCSMGVRAARVIETRRRRFDAASSRHAKQRTADGSPEHNHAVAVPGPTRWKRRIGKRLGGPAPSLTSVLLSLPPAKKPTERLSGDQKGSAAPSVPGSTRAVRESSRRTHSRGVPSEADATNTI